MSYLQHLRRSLTGVLVGILAAGALVAVPPSAQASAPAGSIVYISGNNVWLMAPDGTGKRRVTSDGTAATPYFSPTETDAGAIVALRNGQVGGETLGTVYVMNRTGHLMARFTPPQYSTHGTPSSCGSDYQLAPDGLYRAIVSPDGAHVAYTAHGYFRDASCGTVVDVFFSYVTGIAGTPTRGLPNINGYDGSEVGSWNDAGTVLLSNMTFEHTALYTANAATGAVSLWKSNTNSSDWAWEGPSRAGSVLATSGWSDAAGGNVVRIWTAPSTKSAPSTRCEIQATAGSSDGSIWATPSSWPVTVAPDATALAWAEVNGTDTNTPDEGIYTASVAGTGCPTVKTMIAPGGSWPFWGSAAVDAAVPPDRVAPVVTITRKPGAYLRSTTATIAYRAADTTDVTISTTCTLDGHATGCASTRTLTGLSQGRHTFVVTATDAAHNVGRASAGWTVDTVAPSVSLRSVAPVTKGSSVTFRYGAGDHTSGVAGYDVRAASAGYTGGFGPWAMRKSNTRATSLTLTGLRAGYAYCIEVRARDMAGNTSAWSAPTCTTRPMDDRSLHTTGAWSRTSITSAYLHTETVATHAGATLTLSHAVVGRVGLLVSTSAGGGSVAVYVGAGRLGSVSMHSGTTHHQVLLWLPAHPRTGTLTIRTLSKAPVHIDGLVSVRQP